MNLFYLPLRGLSLNFIIQNVGETYLVTQCTTMDQNQTNNRQLHSD